MVDKILQEDTVIWLMSQNDKKVSITLDIGTCLGITLVALHQPCNFLKMHMGDDRLNLGRLSKMDLDEIGGINVLVNGNKFM